MLLLVKKFIGCILLLNNNNEKKKEENVNHINYESRNGLIHVYTGSGKGKTTTSLGLAFRAMGHGFNVMMIQFMKGNHYGEIESSKKYPNIDIIQFGRAGFVNKECPTEIDKKLAQEGLKYVKEIFQKGIYDFIILDEIFVALDWKLLELDKVIELIENKPKEVELILTGRNAPKEIIDLADYVTEEVEIKHPFSKGIMARKGCEY